MEVKQDPMGTAILDYLEKGCAMKLKVTSSMFDEDEMPVAHLFRTSMEMGALERLALSLCRGHVLDVGAGAGCHSLVLQKQGIDVTAIDVSPLSVTAMRQRGIVNVAVADFFATDVHERFDTILMLMNGIGMVGKVERLPVFFSRLDEFLNPGGCVLTDSSDLRYVFEDEEGYFDPSEFDHYYGEVDYQMRYGKVIGECFDWLYIDFDTLRETAHLSGYEVELLREGEHFDYLAKITKQ